MKNRKILGNLLLLLTAAIWGTAFVSQRVGVESIEPITFTASRMALSAIAVGAVFFFFGRRSRERDATLSDAERRSRRKNTLLGGVCCGSFLAAASVFQQMGIVTTSAGKAGFITAMYILLVPVVGRVLFGRRNTWLVWLAVLTGVVGMYLLCVDESFRLTRGDALVCVCAVLFTGHILCCDHFVKSGDALGISAIQFCTATALSAAAAFATENPSWEKVVSAAIPILYCGILSGGVGYTLQLIAQRYTDPTVASLLMSLEAVFAVTAGALILGERMSARELVGCAVLFAAIVLVQVPLPRKKN